MLSTVIFLGVNLSTVDLREYLMYQLLRMLLTLYLLQVSARAPIETTAPEIAKILEKYTPAVIKADSNPTEYKGWIEKFYKCRVEYVVASYCKGELLAQLQRKLLTGQIEIPECETELIKQLTVYRKGMFRGDDLVDTLALSIYEPAIPYSNRKSVSVIISRMK
jgi:hypothetical protein